MRLAARLVNLPDPMKWPAQGHDELPNEIKVKVVDQYAEEAEEDAHLGSQAGEATCSSTANAAQVGRGWADRSAQELSQESGFASSRACTVSQQHKVGRRAAPVGRARSMDRVFQGLIASIIVVDLRVHRRKHRVGR